MTAPAGWPEVLTHSWQKVSNLPPVSYKCAYCSQHVASSTGYNSYNSKNGATPFCAYDCGSCRGLTLFDNQGRHWPEALAGDRVKDLPTSVCDLYEEARACMSVRAYTAAVLACRKLLMNTAASKGANTNQPFVAYVGYLSAHGYISPDARPWVDHIRSKGNEATHEIPQTTAADATELLTMTEMLLKVVYELPALVNARLAIATEPPPSP